MKTLIIAIFCLASISRLHAQTCKVKIYYDNNGNRIQRVVECPSEHPNPSSVELRSGKKQLNNMVAIAAGSYQVYPNPAANKVNIRLNTELLQSNCGITLTDLTGKVLYQQRSINNPVSEIDLQGYADGTYFVIISTNSDRHTVKIVKQSGSSQ